MTEHLSTEPLLRPRQDNPTQLRHLLRLGRALPVPGAFNAICAKIIEQCGFQAVYISGAGIVNGVAGYPDIGLMTQTEIAKQAGYIARAVNIPAIADADTGFGEALNIYRTVQEFEREGISGLHLEDQIFPKRCGHLAGKHVVPVNDMAGKIRAAILARRNPDFLIIARVDSKAVLGLESVVERARHYLDAGADMIFPEALESTEEFSYVSEQIRATHPHALLLANMTEFGKTPYLSLAEFERLGYNLVIYPLTAFRLMMKTVHDAMMQLLAEGSQQKLLGRMFTREELYGLIHYPDYSELDAQFARPLPPMTKQ